MLERQISYIKEALIIIFKNLEEQAIDQREIIQVLVLVNKTAEFKLTRERFKLKNKDKLRVNLKYPAYYILVQIIYMDNMYNIYKTPKDKYYKYPMRIYWTINKKWYRDAKYIYSQHLVEVQELRDLIL